MSRPEELETTQYFALRLSMLKGEKYSAQSEAEEATDTDTYVVEPSGTPVAIQNVTSEGSLLKNMSLNTKALKNRQGVVASEVNHHDWIKSALAGKEAKKYPNAHKLVVLLHGSLPTPPSDFIAELAPVTSSFAGIYYVSLPSSAPESGYIVALKRYWDTPITF